MPTRSVMIQGTASNACKSAIVTGLCRILERQGITVAPFKPQNMSLNSAVTENGGEIGRAQALQAQACRIAAHTDMNPILLKPNSATSTQVIVDGQAIGNMDARQYHAYKPKLLPNVLAAYERLLEKFDVVIVEGAGSPAEINLRDGDLANMGFAVPARCPVVMIADIDKGGVFAHLIGTHQLLSDEEKGLVRGFIINKFRGDPSLLSSGIDWLEEFTGKPVFGVVPYLPSLALDAEDSLAHRNNGTTTRDAEFKVVVPLFPRISNRTDFHALEELPEVELRYETNANRAAGADLVILPGSKSVREDLEWLRSNGWVPYIQRHLRYGGKLMGICGGFQMLGKAIHDPRGIESTAGSSVGLALLDCETTIAPQKQLHRVAGVLIADRVKASGYEIHMGTTSGGALSRPLMQVGDRTDGAISEDGQIVGTYIHGLFDEADGCSSLLKWAGLTELSSYDFVTIREQNIDRMADALTNFLNLDFLLI